jgi:hypothetical protein
VATADNTTYHLLADEALLYMVNHWPGDGDVTGPIGYRSELCAEQPEIPWSRYQATDINRCTGMKVLSGRRDS